jgi:hypothetical protein
VRVPDPLHMHVFLRFLCNTGSAEGEHNEETYIAKRRKDRMARSFVRKSRGLQSQRCANPIKSQSSQIPMSPSNHTKGVKNGLLDAKGEGLGRWSANPTLGAQTANAARCATIGDASVLSVESSSSYYILKLKADPAPFCGFSLVQKTDRG